MNIDILHPREFIPENVAEQLRNSAYDAEIAKTLHERQLSAIRDRNWFNMYVPRKFGGLELSMPEIIRILEGIAWADGSSAWVVTLCSGASWFIGFLDRALAADVFKSDFVCFAGSGAVNGTANRTANGYEVDGLWPYATGSLLATAFTVNCLIHENGVQVYGTDGSPLVNSFLLLPAEVKIHRTWHAMGMVATGSHSIEVKKTTIPENRSFIINPNRTFLPGTIFRFPFFSLAKSTLTVNLSGMANRFVDLAEAKFKIKNNKSEFSKVGASRVRLQDARQIFYRHTDAAWSALTSEKYIPTELLTQVSEASRNLVDRCAEVVTALYPYCGLEAADTRQEINRVWRNFHTASQHSLFRSSILQSKTWTK